MAGLLNRNWGKPMSAKLARQELIDDRIMNEHRRSKEGQKAKAAVKEQVARKVGAAIGFYFGGPAGAAVGDAVAGGGMDLIQDDEGGISFGGKTAKSRTKIQDINRSLLELDVAANTRHMTEPMETFAFTSKLGQLTSNSTTSVPTLSASGEEAGASIIDDGGTSMLQFPTSETGTDNFPLDSDFAQDYVTTKDVKTPWKDRSFWDRSTTRPDFSGLERKFKDKYQSAKDKLFAEGSLFGPKDTTDVDEALNALSNSSSKIIKTLDDEVEDSQQLSVWQQAQLTKTEDELKDMQGRESEVQGPPPPPPAQVVPHRPNVPVETEDEFPVVPIGHMTNPQQAETGFPEFGELGSPPPMYGGRDGSDENPYNYQDGIDQIENQFNTYTPVSPTGQPEPTSQGLKKELTDLMTWDDSGKKLSSSPLGFNGAPEDWSVQNIVANIIYVYGGDEGWEGRLLTQHPDGKAIVAAMKKLEASGQIKLPK